MTVRGLAWLVLLAAIVLLGLPMSALGATPAPVATPGSDTRSSGQGPGLVGDPALAILGVAAIAALAAAATVAYVRLTGAHSSDEASRSR
jgi:hypothetical protein